MGAPAVKRRCSVCHASYTRGEAFCSLDGGAIVADDGTDDDLVGKTIDNRYLVVRVLGRGGMGKVYEAEHVGLGKRVALKFVSDGEADRDQRARFRQEARAASKIVHEHVVQIFDVGVDSAGRDYIAMEYVEGRDLDALLRSEGRLSPSRAIAIALQLLDGLAACHAAGIVHRDIKPSNIRLASAEDFVKLMDFGIAKSVHAEVAQTDTGTGRVIGTPQFMAPEQLLAEPVDHRADLYAVGATLFAMLAGAPPFDSTRFTQRIQAMSQPAPSIESLRTGLPPALIAAVTRALAPVAADRFTDARAFADALRDAGEVVDARANASTKPLAYPGRQNAPVTHAPVDDRSSARRSRWPLVVGLVAALAIAAGIAFYVTRERTTTARAVAPIDAAPAIAVVPVDAASPVVVAPVDAAVALAPPTAAPISPPRKRVAAAPPAPTGPPCTCRVKTAKGSISYACRRKGAAPRCECNKDNNRLCPFPITVTNNEHERFPDGTKSGTMRCLDRTRTECDWVSGPVPKDCSAMSKVAVAGTACQGYRSGMKDGDEQIEGTYKCFVCDLKPDAPKYYGKTNDPCSGFEIYTGDPVTGVLECPKAE